MSLTGGEVKNFINTHLHLSQSLGKIEEEENTSPCKNLIKSEYKICKYTWSVLSANFKNVIWSAIDKNLLLHMFRFGV